MGTHFYRAQDMAVSEIWLYKRRDKNCALPPRPGSNRDCCLRDMTVNDIWLSARYGCTKEESKIVRCHQERALSMTAVSCQRDMAVREIKQASRYGC